MLIFKEIRKNLSLSRKNYSRVSVILPNGAQ